MGSKGEQWKAALLRTTAFQRCWGGFRRWQLHNEYENRREYYGKIALERGLRYREGEVIGDIRGRLKQRGYSPAVRQKGEVHTFAFIPQISWHSALLPDLRELGPVTLFDYQSLGFRAEEFYGGNLRRRKEMNDLILTALRKAHEQRSVDWAFFYAGGVEVSVSTIRRITDEWGFPVVSMCLDDKQSWKGGWMGDHYAGMKDIGAAFDLSWTTAQVACEWYLVEGARPIYLPEGFDTSVYHPMVVPQDIPISFIGGAYGFRPEVVRFLKNRRIPIQLFGPGWNTETIWGDAQVRVLNRSRINLGMGGIGYSESLTNVKTRDFEIPGTGGGVYITSFNPDLAKHFIIGEEIVCYRNRDEMLELIRYYLDHQDEAREIARKGRECCLREHRWLHRYQRVCQLLGILAAE